VEARDYPPPAALRKGKRYTVIVSHAVRARLHVQVLVSTYFNKPIKPSIKSSINQSINQPGAVPPGPAGDPAAPSPHRPAGGRVRRAAQVRKSDLYVLQMVFAARRCGAWGRRGPARPAPPRTAGTASGTAPGWRGSSGVVSSSSPTWTSATQRWCCCTMQCIVHYIQYTMQCIVHYCTLAVHYALHYALCGVYYTLYEALQDTMYIWRPPCWQKSSTIFSLGGTSNQGL
jgi:hypothetical protein